MKKPRLDVIFEKVYQRTTNLIPCDRFYVALYDLVTQEISFPLVREGKQDKKWKPRPLQKGYLPDDLITEPCEVLYPVKETQKNALSLFSPQDEETLSWIGVPMRQENQVIGLLIAERWQPESLPFDENNLRVLSMVAQQTAPVIANVRLQERLEWKVEALRILNQAGQQLASGLKKSEDDILNLIYSSAIAVGVDAKNMYIAFYEEVPGNPDEFDTEHLEKSEIHGTLRFALAYEEGKRETYPERKAGNGLSEYVIRARKSFVPSYVKKAYLEIAQDQIGKIPRSWLGVPILAEDKVFGVIVLRNNDYAGIYTQDDLEVLEILAGQAAVALRNLHLYQAWEREQEKRLEAERASVFGMVAAEFAHRMNNIAGTIPVRVDMARAYLKQGNSRDTKIIKQLDKIEAETKNLLDAAQAIKQSTETRTPEKVNLKEIVETAREIAKQMYGGDNEIEIYLDIPGELSLSIDRNALLETLTDVIKNGMEAIEKKNGKVEIRAKRKERNIRIRIGDNGKGIPLSEQKKIFDLFYTTKGKEGLGFGLWHARTFTRGLGGDINVENREGGGTLFTIALPSQ